MSDGTREFHAGQRWRYPAPTGFEASRIIVGAIVSFAEREAIVCCTVLGAPRMLPDGTIDTVDIPFLPLTAGALAASVSETDGHADLPADFAEAFVAWRDDPHGLVAFSVPFRGRLDRLIARQMADVADQSIP